MKFLDAESEPGHYTVFLNEDGEKYISLRGLDVNMTHQPGVLETFLHNHYNFFEGMYWILLLVSLLYVSLFYCMIPLLKKLKIYF